MAAQSLWSEFRARIRTLRGWRKVVRMLGQPHPWNRTPGARQGRPLTGPAVTGHAGASKGDQNWHQGQVWHAARQHSRETLQRLYACGCQTPHPRTYFYIDAELCAQVRT